MLSRNLYTTFEYYIIDDIYAYQVSVDNPKYWKNN